MLVRRRVSAHTFDGAQSQVPGQPNEFGDVAHALPPDEN